MNRNRFLVAVLAMGGLLGAAGASSTTDSQQKRLEEFRAKAAAARRAQKLEGHRDALVTKYPTPEVNLEHAVETAPGKELVLKVPGQFLPDSLVTLPCEGVELLSSKVTAHQIEARVRVGPNAVPGNCDIHVYSPVSVTEGSATALRVTGTYAWDLQFTNGMTSHWKTTVGEDEAQTGQSEWFVGGKPVGTRKVELVKEDKGVLVATVQRTEAEENAAAESESQPKGLDPAQTKKLNALFDKMGSECAKLPDEKQAACSQKYMAQVEALQKQMYSQKGPANPKGGVCGEVRLLVQGDKVTGSGSGCGDAGIVQLTGTFKLAK